MYLDNSWWWGSMAGKCDLELRPRSPKPESNMTIKLGQGHQNQLLEKCQFVSNFLCHFFPSSSSSSNAFMWPAKCWSSHRLMIYLHKILFQSKTCSHVSITNTVQIITTDILQTIKPVPLQNQRLTDILQTIKPVPLQNQWLTDILQTIKPVPSQNQWFTTQPIH